jgi:hypothetical protein
MLLARGRLADHETAWHLLASAHDTANQLGFTLGMWNVSRV